MKQESPNALIIAVVAVLVLLIFLGVASVALYEMVRDDGESGGDDYPDDYQLTMTVDGVRGYSESMSYRSSEGFIHAIVYANLTNQGPDTAWASTMFMTMACSNGEEYQYECFRSLGGGGYIESNETMAMSGLFEIPKGATPTTLTYDDHKVRVSVSIPSSEVDLYLSYPHYAIIDVIGVADGEDDLLNSNLTFVIVTVQFTNLYYQTRDIEGQYFGLETSDGMSYDFRNHSDANVPDRVQVGATVIFTVTFEIPKAVSATALMYHDPLDWERVTI